MICYPDDAVNEDGVNDKLCTYGRSIYSLKNGPIVYSSHSAQPPNLS